MRLFELALKAKNVLVGPGKWTEHVRDNGNGAHCALGALEVALGYDANPDDADLAEQDPKGRALIAEMAVELGFPTFEEWKQENKDSLDSDYLTKDQYISDCADTVMSFNDDVGTQRKVQGLFVRVANRLKKKWLERRTKQTVKGILKGAIAGAKTEAKTKELTN